ncbi:hypothetical protein [Hyphomicrobium sp. DY-1]|uniref:hypothetical protein n=1 Tax=Hyphomicrobium sp. DY-1 TaxID=3075650 RepID=UPI0039C12DDD
MANQFHLGAYFSIGNGQFDSRYRFFRRVVNAAERNLYMSSGPTIAINPTSAGQAGWRWQSGPATMASNTLVGVPSGFNSPINVHV